MSAFFAESRHSSFHLEAPIAVMANFSEIIDRLLKRRAELAAEMKKLDDAIETLSQLTDVFADEPASRSALDDDQLSAQGEVSRERSILPPEEIARLAREVLLDNKRPLKRGALVRAMEAKSVPLVGKDKAKNLGTILWRFNGDFVSLKSLGYWPRDIALPGVYDPREPPDGIVSERIKKSSF